MSEVYKSAGVDLDAAKVMNQHSAAMIAETWKDHPFVEVHDRSRGRFRGPKTFVLRNLPEGYEWSVGVDGAGTKTGIVSLAFSHEQAAADIIAMTGGDHTRNGHLPILIANLLDVSKLGDVGSPTFECLKNLFTGLRDVCRQSGIVALGGETAQLGVFVGSDNPDAMTKFNWGAFMLGIWHEKAFINGEGIRPGQRVVALRERGLRSNGYSAVRKAFSYRFGPEYWKNPNAHPYIQAAAIPSTIYDPFLVKANGWLSPNFKDRIPVTGIAHITGGGIPEKFGDVLFPSGLSADLEDLWNPPGIMLSCARWIRAREESVSDKEFHYIFNVGNGALAIMEPSVVPDFISLAQEAGLEAKDCGGIRAPSPEGPCIYLRSKFGGGEVFPFKEK